VLKLAVIFEASQSGVLNVSDRAMQRAIDVASEAEQTIFGFLPTGMSREGSEVEKLADRIRSAGPAGITKSELTRAFQHVRSRDREERLRTLIDSGRIQNVSQKTGGRPVDRYIHQEHLPAAAAGECS
jgi:hypothetical protein